MTGSSPTTTCFRPIGTAGGRWCPQLLTVSVGIGVFPIADAAEGGESDQTGQKLIQLADAALYRAKNGGRNRVES